MSYDYAIADVFTDTPLEGNPVAVFLDAADLDSERMQRTARELNLSETVFITGRDADGAVRIRIFTPPSNCRSPATRCSAPRSYSRRATRTDS